jgi:hypothetical protein
MRQLNSNEYAKQDGFQRDVRGIAVAVRVETDGPESAAAPRFVLVVRSALLGELLICGSKAGAALRRPWPLLVPAFLFLISPAGWSGFFRLVAASRYYGPTASRTISEWPHHRRFKAYDSVGRV